MTKEVSLLYKELRRKGHCGKTEQCADDMYCNCPCLQCQSQECYRPGCRCNREHPTRFTGYW